MTGPLALVGGAEWSEGCTFDAELLAAAGTDEVVLLLTAAAFENPAHFAERAAAWFAPLGASVSAVHVFDRGEAMDPANAATLAAARFLYLAGDSPMHLRAVLKDTPVWEAVVSAWQGGAAVAVSRAAGSALLDPMFDPRGGAFTVGLGLLRGMAFLPNAEDDVVAHHQRTLDLAEPGLPLATVQARTALVLTDGKWRAAGAGRVRVFVDGEEQGLEALPVD